MPLVRIALLDTINVPAKDNLQSITSTTAGRTR